MRKSHLTLAAVKCELSILDKRKKKSERVETRSWLLGNTTFASFPEHKQKSWEWKRHISVKSDVCLVVGSKEENIWVGDISSRTRKPCLYVDRGCCDVSQPPIELQRSIYLSLSHTHSLAHSLPLSLFLTLYFFTDDRFSGTNLPCRTNFTL